MHYMHIVMELSYVAGHWQKYDQEFRVARVEDPQPWHTVNIELLLHAFRCMYSIVQ